MTRRLIVRSVAERDLLAAYTWYEDRALHLGRDFLGSIDVALDQIAKHPLAGREYFRDYRRKLVRRFPYGIFYIVTVEAISIVAVMHLAQSPIRLKQALDR